MNKNITVDGPFFEYSSRCGIVSESLNRDVWFVSRSLSDKELNDPKISEISRILKGYSLGVIVRYQNKKHRYIIRQLHPHVEFTSLKKAVAFLIENEGKLVFCT